MSSSRQGFKVIAIRAHDLYIRIAGALLRGQ